MLLLIYGIVFTNWGPTDRQTDGRTDGRTDRPTDIASYRDALDASKKSREEKSIFLSARRRIYKRLCQSVGCFVDHETYLSSSVHASI